MNIDSFIGTRFEQWVVVSYSHKNEHYQYFFHCKCDCGRERILDRSRLVNGYAKRCSVCANALRRKHKPVEIGAKYGKWTVISEDAGDKRFVNAQCTCNVIKRLAKSSLIHGESTQCGSCRGRVAATRHGHNCKGKTSAEYRAWGSAKSRVFKSNNCRYKNYGGRGITMCDRWIDSFENFLEDVGIRPSAKHSLDRIDNNGNYEPNNVRWVLATEQVQNRSITFKVNGQYINVKELARELKIHGKTVKNLLLKAKFTIEEVQKFSELTHYQKIEMGKSINKGKPYSFVELETLQSPVLPSPKRHPLWCTWHSMKQRCNNPKNKDYHNYGAKGIKVCKEWATFQEFLMSILGNIGDKPSMEHQLDRIDNKGNYEIGNIRWSTRSEQSRNKSTTLYIDGKGISAQEKAIQYGMYVRTVVKLIRLGWNDDGLKFFAQLSYKEKQKLKILSSNVLQKDAIRKHSAMATS